MLDTALTNVVKTIAQDIKTLRKGQEISGVLTVISDKYRGTTLADSIQKVGLAVNVLEANPPIDPATLISDSLSTSTTKVWSIDKTKTEINNTIVNRIVDSTDASSLDKTWSAKAINDKVVGLQEQTNTLSTLVNSKAKIDDTKTNTTDTWSSKKISDTIAATAGVSINDTTASGTTTYSSNKIDEKFGTVNNRITAAETKITNLLADAPEAYDTLKEIADYINNDTNAGAAIVADLSNTVRFTTQTLTEAQQQVARVNIGVDVTSDLRAVYIAERDAA